MQIAVHILAYNVNRFIGAALKNVAPHVDKIYVAYPKRPWDYTSSSRQDRANPTQLSHILAAGLGSQVEIIEGDWASEEDMRNACFLRAKSEGFDWLLIQDADELYEERCWHQIRKALSRNSQREHFKSTWYNFWKSSEYVLMHPSGEIKHTNAGFAVRCLPHLSFTSRRLTNAAESAVIDAPCHHYSYVMTDLEMSEKLTTWGHSHETNAELWFRLKWRNWRESTRFLHPVYPTVWSRAIRWPMIQPDFADEFALDLNPASTVPIVHQLEDLVFDGRALVGDGIRRFKRRVRLAAGPK